MSRTISLPVAQDSDARPTHPPTRLSVQSPNQIARSLTGRDYLSYSQIRTFQTCPLKWHFQYVLGLAPEFTSASLLFGTAIHAAIERFYRAQLHGETVPTLSQLMATFDAEWSKVAEPELRFGKDESPDTLRDQAIRALQAFMDSASAQPAGRILGVEETLVDSIIPEVPDLLARLDLIIVTDDALIIRDFKTARARWNTQQIEESAPQLQLYEMLAQPLADAWGLPIQLEFVVLTKTRKPQIDTHTVKIEPAVRARTEITVQAVWQAMQAGHVYPNPSPMNCSNCPYQGTCRAWPD